MTPIQDTDSLAALCRRLADADYVAVDTEFIREKTYWPVLCLVQLAGPDEAVAVDPLAEGLDLAPLLTLMDDPSVLKVLHSGRQDVEIFHALTGRVPAPLFDTQIAAMVCGFGESVAYDTLVARLTKVRIDKSSRFTDWSRRPLTDRQLDYALADVIHLRPVYEAMRDMLAENGRSPWIDEDMAQLTAPETYAAPPEDAWRRFKTRSHDPRFLAVLREVAAWREGEAQRRNLPRGRILRDEAVLEIAAHTPATAEDLARTRGLARSTAEGRFGTEILAAVQRGRDTPKEARPRPPARQGLPSGLGPLVDLLKVLLKMVAEDSGVAQRLIASAADLESIAADDGADVPALAGWRRTLFGDRALALKHGRIALAADGRRIRLIEPAEPA